MKKLKIVAGTIWAILCLLLIIILFPGLNSLSASAAKLPFMKINPNYTGGEVAREINNGNYTIDIRKPVFAGLVHDRKTGFVQVDWKGKIPVIISDTIDYDSDGRPDFRVMIDRESKRTKLESFDSRVGTVRVSVPTSYGWAIRVNLQK